MQGAFLSVFLCLCLWMTPCQGQAAVTLKFVKDTLAPAIKKLIQTNSIQGAVLRLAFHDCAGAGGCDGCVNSSLPENAGLHVPVLALESMYKNLSLSSTISRADYWALSGIVAVNMAMKNKAPTGYVVPDAMDPLKFKYGRKDCTAAPTSTNDRNADFPSGYLNNSGVLSYFAARFGFNANQSVAIMGAHSLGRMHKDRTGFDGPWVQGNSSGTMDGQYYRNLANDTAGWRQRAANCSLQPIQHRIQWADKPGAPCLNMLNADMALYKDLGAVQFNGAVRCTYNSCPMAATSAAVLAYGKDFRAFHRDFASAFNAVLSVCGRNANGSSKACTLTQIA